MPRVFISHSSLDHELVERVIISPLRAHGVETWYSTDDIKSASEWERQIHVGLKESEWFLVALTPRSVASEWVGREVHWAVLRRKERIVPVMLETCEPDDLHLGLLPLQFIDFRKDVAKAQDRLLAVWGLNRGAQAEAHYRAAQYALAREDWDTAVERLEAVLRLDPAHARAEAELGGARRQKELAELYSAGREHLRAERWGEALKSFRRVRAMDKGYGGVSELIAEADAGLEEEETRRSQREEEGRKAKEEADRQERELREQRESHQQERRERQAGEDAGSKERKEAESARDGVPASIKGEPQRAAGNSRRRLYMAGAALLAVLSAVAAYALWRNDTWPREKVAEDLYVSAEALRSQEKYAEAEAGFRRAVELHPANDVYHNALGSALFHQGKYKDAEDEIRLAIQLTPYGRPDYRSNLGDILYAQDMNAEAAYREAVQGDTESPLFHKNLGVVLNYAGKFDESKSELQRAEAGYRKALLVYRYDVDKVPGQHSGLAAVLYHQGKFADAEAEYRNAITLSAKADYYYGLGNALYIQSKYQDAAAAYKAAISRNPSKADYQNGAGNTFFSQGEYWAAGDAYQRAISLYPGNAVFNTNLGDALTMQNRRQDAAVAYARAKEIASRKTSPVNHSVRPRDAAVAYAGAKETGH